MDARAVSEASQPPRDGNGPIAGWSLTLSSSDWTPITSPSPNNFDWNGETAEINGIAFSLADFTGGAGTLTGVTGLTVNGGGSLDFAQLGVAAIPEPASLALLGLGGLLIAGRRRQA